MNVDEDIERKVRQADMKDYLRAHYTLACKWAVH